MGAGALTVLATVVVLSLNPLIGAAVAVAVPMVLILTRVPVAWLPSLALVAYAVIPEKLYSASDIVKAVSVGTIILLLWFARGMSARRAKRGAFAAPAAGQFGIIVALCLVLWFVLLLAFGSSDGSSPGWVISFTLAVLLPFFYRNYTTEGVHLRRTAAFVGATIGAFAIIEAAIGANPLFDTIYAAFDMSNSQHWSVYRAEAASGHPLYAATLLASCAAVALGGWLEPGTRRSRGFYLLSAGLAAGGVIGTVSRGGLAALAGAFAVVVCFAIFRGGRGTAIKVIGLGVLSVGAYYSLDFALFAARGASNEAGQSADARENIIDLALFTARSTGWLGAGPGGSQLAVEAATGSSLLLESSPLQLLVSLGVPGLLLLAILIVILITNIFKTKNIAALGGLVAFLIATSGYNAIDALRTIHVLLGCVVIMALAPAPSALAAVKSPEDAGSAAEQSSARRLGRSGVRA